MNKFLVVFLAFIALNCASSKPSSPIFIDKVFAYEIDEQLWSIDDMIYRKPALYLYDGSVLNKNIYIFEDHINEIDIDIYNLELQQKVVDATNFFNSTYHNFLSNESTEHVKFKGKTYKIFNIKCRVLHLGETSQPIIHNYKVKYEKIETYLILEFDEIMPIN